MFITMNTWVFNHRAPKSSLISFLLVLCIINFDWGDLTFFGAQMNEWHMNWAFVVIWQYHPVVEICGLELSSSFHFLMERGWRTACSRVCIVLFSNSVIFFSPWQQDVIMLKWPDSDPRTRCHCPRKFDNVAVDLADGLGHSAFHRVHLWLTSQTGLALTFLAPQRGSQWYIPLPPQLRVGTYHACLTGGSCHAVCDKRLKHWTRLNWSHNSCIVPGVTLHPLSVCPHWKVNTL